MNQNLTTRLFFVILLLACSVANAQTGLEWKEVLSQTSALSIGLNPVDNDVIYTQKDGFFMVSLDRGETWQQRGAVPGAEDRNIAVFPPDTSVILMYSAGSILKTTDGGRNWRVVLSGVSMDGETIFYHPTSPDTVYYADFIFGNFFVSSDTGSTWQVRASMGVTSVCAMAVNPANPKIIVAGGGNTRAVRTTDGGFTWSIVKTGNSYFSEIPKLTWDKNNPDVIYGTAYLDEQFSIFKSTDAGENWFTEGLFGIPMWGLDIDAGNGEIYMGSFDEFEVVNRGIFKSYDNGKSWQRVGQILNNANWMIKIAGDHTVYALSLQGAFGVGSVYRLDPAPLGKVTGIIRDSQTGTPIEFATVTVEGTNDTVWVGNVGGVYTAATQPGTYDLKVRVGSFEKTVSNVNFSANSTVTLDIDVPLLVQYDTFSGNVSTLDNQPLKAEIVIYGRVNGAIPRTVTAQTDANGNFNFDSLSNLVTYDSIEVLPEHPYLPETVKPVPLNGQQNFNLDVADILVIDNLNVSIVKQFHDAVLGFSGLTYSEWQVGNEGSAVPNSVVELTKKRAVYLHGIPLSPTLADSLSAMIDAGQHLFITGSFILNFGSGFDLFANKLKLGFAGPGPELFVSSFENNALGLDLAFPSFPVPLEAIDVQNPAARKLFHYTETDTTAIAGVTFDNTGAGGKAVILGFDMAAGGPNNMAPILLSVISFFDAPVGIDDELVTIPLTTELQQNYPNPFNPSTQITYSLGKTADATLIIYNILGQEVRTLVNATKRPAGQYTVTWDGRNDQGTRVASGMYVYQLKADGVITTHKMLLLR